MKKYTSIFNINLKPELLDKFRAYSERVEIPMSRLVRDCIKNLLKEEKTNE